MTISRGPLTLRGAFCLLAAFALIITALVAVIPTAKASENVPGTHIGYPNTFYAYVNAGEEINAVFTKGNDTGAFSDVTVTLEGPGFAGAACHFPVTSPGGTECNFDGPIVAEQSGIWKADFVVNDGSVQAHYPGLLLARGGFQWNVGVFTGDSEIPGRVWSDSYFMSQPLPNSDLPDDGYFDLTFWFQSEFGVLYEVAYPHFNGIHSVFEADPVGVRHEGTCEPAYRSVFFNDAAFSPADGECGDGAFKLFYEHPDPTLPASALTWDGGTEWINPPVPDAPEILNLAFTPDSPDINSGLLTFGLTNFPSGAVIVKVDTDGDGNFDGPGDCSANVAVVNGSVEYPFDGLTCGDDPQPIPPSQEIAFEVIVDNIAEIHFVNFDVEGRGGIAVTQLTGPGAGDTTINWDDSYLNQDRDDDPERNFALPPLGRADVSTTNAFTWLLTTWPGCHLPGPVKGGCENPTFVGEGVDSTGGVHGWEFNPQGGEGGLALGWGNNRHIDDWKFVDIADVVETLRVPPRTSTFAIEKSSDPASGSEVEPGDVITYSVAITNLDDPAAVSLPAVVVNDDLSDVLDDATVTSGPTATSGSAAIVGNTLTWEGDLAASTTVTVTYQVTVNASDDLGNSEIRNVVTTADERSVNCPPGGDAGPECRTEHEVVERSSTFALAKSSNPASGSEVDPGDEITYDVTITNLDDPDAVAIEDVVVNDDLSDVLDDATVTAGPTATSGSASITGDTLTWEGTLAAGESVTVTYTVTVNDEDDLGDRVIRNVVSSDDERSVNCPPGDPGPECSTEHEVPEPPDPPEPPTPPGPETEVGGETEGPETDVAGATESAGALAFTGAGFGYLILVALMMLGAGVALFESTRRRAGMRRL